MRRILLAALAGLLLILAPFGVTWLRNSWLMGRAMPFRPPPTPPLAGGEHTRSSEEARQRAQEQFPKTVVRYGDRRQEDVALTFDDGPDLDYTPRILDVLRKKRANATFYFTGARTEAYPEVVRQVLREGHEIGNHSFDHPRMAALSAEDIRYQIGITDDIIQNVTGRRPITFRPPYGEVSALVLEQAADLGHLVILWDIDTLDWRGLSKEQILTRALKDLKPGSIILMHSASGGPKQDLSGTVEALPYLIDAIRARGFNLVTVSEMHGVFRCCP